VQVQFGFRVDIQHLLVEKILLRAQSHLALFYVSQDTEIRQGFIEREKRLCIYSVNEIFEMCN
jgi:hypothetical protein